MADTEQWPPRSPLKTLLSSPSGRRKYREYQGSGSIPTSPSKLLGSPSLLDKLRAARADRDLEFLEAQNSQPAIEEEEEDEETLQLKLQAIEAKLKLKKLQQKAKDLGSIQSRPSTSSATQFGTASSRIEVALSPTKRNTDSVLKSPRRVVLGIDKGITAADASLKRARVVNDNGHSRSRLPKSSSLFNQTFPRSSHAANSPSKSFSERMAELRGNEKLRDEKRSAIQNARSSRFKLDKTELNSYHTAAGLPSAITTECTDDSRRASPIRTQNTDQRDPNTSQPRSAPTQSRILKHTRSLPSLRSTSPLKDQRSTPLTQDSLNTTTDDAPRGDPSLYEPFSDTHLSTRILPHTFLKRTLPSDQFDTFTLRKLLKTVVSPDYQMPDEVTDYVVFGIIASKSAPRDHKARTADTNTTSSAEWEKKWDDGTMNRQKFIVMTLTDLKWTVDLFLFDTAVPRYHRLTPGTLIAILNPSIMPPKRGREDTGAFSLALHNGDDQVLEIGTSKHLGYCKSKRKDGSQCGTWVDGSKTEICEWHLNAELDRARSKRMGVNSMGGFNGQRKKERNFHHGFDTGAQSFYYAVGGTAPKRQKEQQWSFAPTPNSSLSTAKLLDSTNPDDPFVASGQMLERDKQDRLRKQMAAQEKEREIARRLGGLGHKGGAGGEYFRQRTTTTTTAATDEPEKAVKSSLKGSAPKITRDDIISDKPGEGKKRAAESIRLSPVKKKTRFLTSGGIKVAGRDSLGPRSEPLVAQARRDNPQVNGRGKNHDNGNNEDDDDDDDDLDII